MTSFDSYVRSKNLKRILKRIDLLSKNLFFYIRFISFLHVFLSIVFYYFIFIYSWIKEFKWVCVCVRERERERERELAGRSCLKTNKTRIWNVWYFAKFIGVFMVESSCLEVEFLRPNLRTAKLNLRNTDDRSGRHKNRRQVSWYNSPDKLRASRLSEMDGANKYPKTFSALWFTDD